MTRWIYVPLDGGDRFLTGEVMAEANLFWEVRPVHVGSVADAAEANDEPPHVVIVPIEDVARDGVRVFENEQALRDWFAWLFRPETIKEARQRLRPGT